MIFLRINWPNLEQFFNNKGILGPSSHIDIELQTYCTILSIAERFLVWQVSKLTRPQIHQFIITRSLAIARIADILPHSRLYSNWQLLPNSIPSCSEILRSKHIWVTSWPFGVTWRHRSRDRLIPRRPFAIVGPLEPSLYLLVSEIFNGECDATVNITLNDL